MGRSITETAAGVGEGRERAAAAGPPAPYLELLRRLESGRSLDPAVSALVGRAVEVWSRPGFDTFISLPHLRFEPFAHQVQT